MTNRQTFIDPGAVTWLRIDFLPGVELMPLAQPVLDGSIHRARLAAGTTIPVHIHPADEFVLVLSVRSKPVAGAVTPAHSGPRLPAFAKDHTSQSPTSSCLPCDLGPWDHSTTMHSDDVVLALAQRWRSDRDPRRAEPDL